MPVLLLHFHLRPLMPSTNIHFISASLYVYTHAYFGVYAKTVERSWVELGM